MSENTELLEKLDRISFLENLGYNNDTIEAIEDLIENPDDNYVVTDWRELGL